MIKKRRWLWVILFISAALLLSILATGWNVVLVKDYQNVLAMAHSLAHMSEAGSHGEINLLQSQWILVLQMIVGTAGFVAVLGLTISLFIKLLSEMRLNQIQSEFLAAISHELKTPIASIELTSSLLRSQSLLPEEASQLWHSHQSELNRLKEEVNALLEAARLQAKPRKLFPRNLILLETWIQQSMPVWKSNLGPQALLRREGDPLPIAVGLDPRALSLIFDNLVSNAKKYAQRRPEVVIKTQKIASRVPFKRAKWQIEIRDAGWGFDPSDAKKIFHRFFRAKTHAPYAIPGTGLGLYLAYTASRAMGLKLKGSSPGFQRGAVFTLEGSAGR